MNTTANEHEIAEYAAALLAEATDSGRLDRERTIVERFDSLASSPIPRRALLVAVSGQVDHTPALKLCAEWAAKRRTGIVVLSGPVGTGKTVAAAWYACKARASWCAAPMLGLASHAVAHADLERLRREPALVLDEVGGQGTTTAHAIDRIATLLSQRHGDMRPTIVTTNLDRDDFAMAFDGVGRTQSRLLDRVAEDGRWCVVAGPSRRSTPVEIARGKVDDAREFVRLVEHATAVVAGGDPQDSALRRLQALLGVDADALSRRIALIAESRARVDALVHGVLQRVRA